MSSRTRKIVLDRVSVAFGERIVVQDVSLSLQEHDLLCIFGTSGSGKTTLLRAVAGLIPLRSGRILLGDAAITRPTPRIAMIFQHFGLFPWKTVRANIEYGLSVQGRRGEDSTVTRLLDVMGLTEHATRYPYQLSGGMQQRVSISRALIHDPPLLLMDEPFGALDAITRDEMNLELLRIWGGAKKTVLFITHSIPEAVFLGDRVIVMTPRPGKIAEIVPVDLPRPRTTVLRDDPKFIGYVRKIRERLGVQ